MRKKDRHKAGRKTDSSKKAIGSAKTHSAKTKAKPAPTRRRVVDFAVTGSSGSGSSGSGGSGGSGHSSGGGGGGSSHHHHHSSHTHHSGKSSGQSQASGVSGSQFGSSPSAARSSGSAGGPSGSHTTSPSGSRGNSSRGSFLSSVSGSRGSLSSTSSLSPSSSSSSGLSSSSPSQSSSCSSLESLSTSSSSSDTITFVKLWETVNELNFVYNGLPKDDPPQIPRNVLYLVNPFEPGTSSFNYKLQMNFPVGADPTQWVCGMFDATTGEKVGHDTAFGADSIADVTFWDPGSLTGQQAKLKIKPVGGTTYIPVEVPELAPGSGLIVEFHSGQQYIDSQTVLVTASNIAGPLAGFPCAANMLRMFIFNNTNNMMVAYRPTSVNTIPFNCLSAQDPMEDWLTHNAGALFADNGSVTLNELVWDDLSSQYSTKYGTVGGSALQFREVENSYWQNVLLDDIAIDWSGYPVGYEAWVTPGNEPNAWYDLMPTYPTNPGVLTLGDNNHGSDVYMTFARVRVVQHKIQYKIRKLAQLRFKIVDRKVQGEFIDLYDFNILTGLFGGSAAIVQLGFGRGNRQNEGIVMGRIFRNRVIFQYPPKLPP